MAATGIKGWLAVIALTLVASGCDFARPSNPAPPPPPSEPEPPAPATITTTPPTLTSRELALRYGRLQRELLVQGLLRQDGGGPDAPFTDTQLARNFVRIALFNEYRDDSDFSRPQATISKLRRWTQPIRMSIEFGDTVPEPQRVSDRSAVASYVLRLSELTGVPITLTTRDPNFRVLFLNEDERRAYSARLPQLIPGIPAATQEAFRNLPSDQLCVVIGAFEAGRSNYTKAIALIRAEHTGVMRTACIHEELAQGMGLANDSPNARPSIFNDDEEFALLTRHDELLLRMLYDPRFSTGMAPADAAPIARMIARELLAEGAT